jgi:ribosomal-protein-alanine N-acetyltransferase
MELFSEIPIIETERLLLRQLEEKDAEGLLANLSDPDVTEHMGISPLKNVDEAEKMISFLASLSEKNIAVRWAIERKSDGKLVGTCGFNGWERNRGSRVEIAYDLGKPYWKKGYMSEVLEALLAFCFESLNFNRVEAYTNLEAAPSINLLSKFKFMQDGILREYAYFHGEYIDQRCFSLLKREWVLRRGS